MLLSKHKYTNTLMQWAAVTAAFLTFALPIQMVAKNICLGITLGLILLSGNWHSKFQSLKPYKSLFFGLLFVIFCFIGITYNHLAPTKEALSVAEKYLRVLYPVFLIPLFAHPKYRNWTIHGLFCGACALFILVLLNKFGIIDIQSWRPHKPMGPSPAFPFMHHIYGSFIFSLIGFFSLHFMLKKKKHKWFYILVFIITVIQVWFLSLARTGYMVSILLYVVFLCQVGAQYKQHFFKLLIAAIILAGSLLTFSTPFKQGIHRLYTATVSYQKGDEQSSSGLRMRFIKDSFRIWVSSPLIGLGTGSYPYAAIKFGALNPIGQPASLKNKAQPHDEYAHILVQLGMIGFLLYLTWLTSVWLDTRKISYPMHRYCAQGLVLAFLLGCCFDTLLFLSVPGDFFIVTLSLFLSQTQKSPSI